MVSGSVASALSAQVIVPSRSFAFSKSISTVSGGAECGGGVEFSRIHYSFSLSPARILRLVQGDWLVWMGSPPCYRTLSNVRVELMGRAAIVPPYFLRCSEVIFTRRCG